MNLTAPFYNIAECDERVGSQAGASHRGKSHGPARAGIATELSGAMS
ncbi:hypothetical protein COLO4_06013 [Corchorus olitorius]|uniref:Uncharacterized protein n=1 Tax=Corchorus olitorius TaxID=93759 RepID=A0A1R3KPB4_9ROSI|nr:hypothetical protein COLO4_06013 [Corchorus olitorius]